MFSHVCLTFRQWFGRLTATPNQKTEGREESRKGDERLAERVFSLIYILMICYKKNVAIYHFIALSLLLSLS